MCKATSIHHPCGHKFTIPIHCEDCISYQLDVMMTCTNFTEDVEESTDECYYCAMDVLKTMEVEEEEKKKAVKEQQDRVDKCFSRELREVEGRIKKKKEEEEEEKRRVNPYEFFRYELSAALTRLEMQGFEDSEDEDEEEDKDKDEEKKGRTNPYRSLKEALEEMMMKLEEQNDENSEKEENQEKKKRGE